MIRMHAAPSPASSPAEKWPNDEKAETRAPGNEKAPNRCPGLFRIPDRPSTGEMGGRLLVQRGRRQLVPIVEGVRGGAPRLRLCAGERRSRYAGAASLAWTHKNIQHTVRYTELSPTRNNGSNEVLIMGLRCIASSRAHFLLCCQ